MTQRIPSTPPYFDRRLDFWKSCLLFCLFAILLVSALFWHRLQPETQLALVDQPHALPTIRLELIPTLLPTQTAVASVGNPLALPRFEQMATDPAIVALETVAGAPESENVAPPNNPTQDEIATPIARGVDVVATNVAATQTAVTNEMLDTATPIQSTIVEPPVVEPPIVAPATSTNVPPVYVPASTPATDASANTFSAETPASMNEALTLEASLIPLTLSYPPPNAALPAAVVSRLEGTGAPGTLIALNYIHCSSCTTLYPDRRATDIQGQMLMQPLGSALADERGRWQLQLLHALPPGQHYLLLTQMRSDGTEIGTAGVSFTVLEEAIGPLALSIPMITFPAPAALIDLSQLEDEQLVFHGAALPGQRIQLYINGSFAGETMTDAIESWHIPVAQVLSPGSYIAHVFALDPNGNVVAESAPAAFVILRQNRG